MKKVLPQILLLLLIYLGIFFTIGSWEPTSFCNDLIIAKNYPSRLKDDNKALTILKEIQSDSTKMKWEYLKERLFVEGNPRVDRLQDSVTIYTILATPLDSLALIQAINNVNAILPQLNIGYAFNFQTLKEYDNYFNGRTFYGTSSRIKFHFVEDIDSDDYRQVGLHYSGFSKLQLKNDNFLSYFNPSLIGGDYIFLGSAQLLKYEFNNSLPFQDRLEYLNYGLFRNLCAVQRNSPIQLIERTNAPPYAVYSYYSSEFFLPDIAMLTEEDIFLLQKLYSDDFHEQFADYMYDTYPWRYAINFLSKEKAKVVAILLLAALSIIAAILGISIFYNLKLKYDILKYIFPSLMIWISYTSFLNLFTFLTDLQNTFGYFQMLLMDSLYALLGIISGMLLYFLEKSLSAKWQFPLLLLLKLLMTFLVLILPVCFFGLIVGSFEQFTTIRFLGRFLGPVLTLSLGRGVFIYLNHYSENLVKEKDLELSALREANTTSQLRLLQSQINPHFLYNSLNSIAGLAHKDADKTEQMALSLSDLFRYTVGQKNKNFSTVMDEVEMVKRYLEIEQIRFGDRLDYNVFVEDGLEKQEIPRFVLQPLVENAIKHGISKIEGKGVVALTLNSKENLVIISVSDNGPHFPDGLLNGHGLQSVYDLLKLHYGGKASLNWTNEPKKKIEIRIPKA